MATSLTLSYSDVLSTTLFKWYQTGKIPDQIFKGLTLFKYLDSRVEKLDGGDRIQIPLMVATNPTAVSYRNYDLLRMDPSETLNSAFFDWKQFAVGIFISGLEMNANNGESQVFNLWKARYNNAVLSAQSALNTMLFSDGTGNSSKDFLGLQAIVAASPSSGTLGGINRATAGNEFWRNQSLSCGSFESNGLRKMRQLWLDCSQNVPVGKPTFWITDADTYERYENTIQPLERFTTVTGGQKGDAGFGSLTFKQAPIEFDDAAPSGKMYALNTNVLHFVVHKNVYFKPTEKEQPIDQDAYSQHLLLMGELCTSAPRHLGVLTSITD